MKLNNRTHGFRPGAITSYALLVLIIIIFCSCKKDLSTPTGEKETQSTSVSQALISCGDGQVWETQDNMVAASFDFNGQLQGGV